MEHGVLSTGYRVHTCASKTHPYYVYSLAIVMRLLAAGRIQQSALNLDRRVFCTPRTG